MKKSYLFVWIFLTIIFITYFLSVGYAAVSVNATIEGIMASIKPTALVRITNVLVNDSTDSGSSNSDEYNLNSINGSIVLPYATSSITFKVSITVYLESIMKLTQITGLNSNLDFELSGYEFGSALCNTSNECNFGATDDIYLTIKYKDGAYDSSNTIHSIALNFDFDVLDSVAQVGSTYYASIQEAIDSIENDNTKTTVTLLRSTSEAITIPVSKNIDLNLQGFTLSNSGTTNVIINNGTLHISNGVITSNASFGAIDNLATGSIYMTGGSIIATGSRQAIYNNGGYVEISGSSYLSNTAGDRAVIQNLANGSLVVTGGSIISERRNAIDNTANMVIGVKDGTVSNTSPYLQGANIGISSTTGFSIYDGIIKGVSASISNVSLITDMEDGYGLLNSSEEINMKLYKVTRLAQIYTVTFNANGGTGSETTRSVERGESIGLLPTATQEGYYFDGWFTSLEGGTKVSKDDIILADTEVFAHWSSVTDTYIARIGDTSYSTLQEAIEAVPKNNDSTTVTLLHDTSESLTIASGQNIVLDLQDYVISNLGTSNVINNNGTLTINNGTITSNTSQGAVNNNKGGKLYMSGGSIIVTGTRQAIYNNGGYAEISGTVYLSSTTSQRATIQNINGGTIIISGGTIISTGFNAVDNAAKLTIGIQDSEIDSSSPILIGKSYGISNKSSLKVYDGIIKGIDGAISGDVDEFETDSTRIDSTETINGDLYHTLYLEN